jgi:hypothetical protein
MKADVQYNDFRGFAAADIADHLGGPAGDNLSSLAKRFKLDQNRFKIIGLSLYGLSKPSISLICVDNEKSRDGQEHIVSMFYDVEGDDPKLEDIFKRLNIVLHDKRDDQYSKLDYVEEVSFSDLHEQSEE